MAVRDIVIYGQAILRMQPRSVEAIDASVQTLIDDMIETMQDAEGIGLSAPQVGESLSLCVVNLGLIVDGAMPQEYINPVILQQDGKTTMEEGCLSIPDIREDVERSETTTVRYQDAAGQQHEEECDGLLARVLQHELDHLNGILFIDRISPIKRKLLAKKLKKIAAQE